MNVVIMCYEKNQNWRKKLKALRKIIKFNNLLSLIIY
jgi:hypothetical protein